MSETMVDMGVDPQSIPERMTSEQLQWWILFTIAVAGKTAKTIETKMRAFMALNPSIATDPFGIVKAMIIRGKLGHNLRKVKLGKYKLLNKGFRAALELDLDLLARADYPHALALLSAIPGLGPKGSRMVMMYAFPSHANQWVVLDVHILRWLRQQGIEAPKATPPEGRTYQRLEREFKKLADDRNMTTRQLDTEIWAAYSRK
ncbi:N-glycosylase/DNA lyase [uncultured archaeon]|nr:N-glycosylase/DNA lyase [uncultured archaeon]